MTHSKSLRHVGWTAAALAVCVLSLNAQAGPRERGQKKQRQTHRQTQNDHGRQNQRQRANQSRPSQREARASNSRQTQRGANNPRASQRRNGNLAHVSANNQRASQRRSESSAHTRASVVGERGANWGVNAQRKNLKKRQQTVGLQTQRLEQQTQASRRELRDTRQRLDARAHRLNAKSNALQHVGRYNKPAAHASSSSQYKSRSHPKPSHSYSYSRNTHGRAGHNNQGVNRSYGGRHNDRSRFGFRIGFGSNNSSQFYYVNGHRRYGCDTGGYYTTRWVRPLYATRYDHHGNPYTVVIRAGYYKRVWVNHYCRRGLHHYSAY